MKRYYAVAVACLAVAVLLMPRPATPKTPPDGLRYVALTFDDGPHPGTTERLLDGLRERGVKATFFLIGEQIADNRATVQRMAQEGHQIGNHTYSHTRLDQRGEKGLEELRKTDAILRETVGDGTFWVRPPWGFIDAQTANEVRVPLIYWSVDPEDWRTLNASAVAQHLIRNAQDGDILLLHDSYDTSVDAALAAIDALTERGFRFVTVEELFAIKGVEPRTGVLYTKIA